MEFPYRLAFLFIVLSIFWLFYLSWHALDYGAWKKTFVVLAALLCNMAAMAFTLAADLCFDTCSDSSGKNILLGWVVSATSVSLAQWTHIRYMASRREGNES